MVDSTGAEARPEYNRRVGHVIYDAYGQIVTNTIPLTLTDRLFTGQVFDASTGLYYYNARFYDPFTGQFTQPDSVIPDPLDPRAWNRFSYVYGNPVNFTDPSGHNPLYWLISGGIGGILNVATNICNMPGGCISGYFDGRYSVEQRSQDFAIGFAAGALAYGSGGITSATLVRYGVRGAVAEVVAPTLRIGLLSTINVGEAGLSSLAHGQPFTVNDAASAAAWGLIGAGAAEFLGPVLNKLSTRAVSAPAKNWHINWRNPIRTYQADYGALRASSNSLRGLSSADFAKLRYNIKLLNGWAAEEFIRSVETPYRFRKFGVFLAITSLTDVEPYGTVYKFQPLPNPPVLIPGRF